MPGVSCGLELCRRREHPSRSRRRPSTARRRVSRRPTAASRYDEAMATAGQRPHGDVARGVTTRGTWRTNCGRRARCAPSCRTTFARTVAEGTICAMATQRFLTLADVAEVLNISASQTYALVRSGELE